ncbi:MAG: TetR/AcrR family transcriptional regulator [Chloroflexi bacterium]|nr:TetR/AcrR family transcriptional regulator [Chloroflexota bacterium]
MSPKVTEEYLEERRQQIINAAEVCFARLGIHGTTLENIRTEAGLSRGAVYHYFKSKEDIVEGLRERSREEDMSAFEQNVTGGDALGDLLAMFRYALQRNIGPRRHIDSRVATFLWAEALINARIHATQIRLLEANRPLALRLVKRAQEEGQINPDLPSEAVIDSLFSMAIGLTIFAAWEPDKDMGPALQVAEALATGTFLTQPHSSATGS